MITLTPQRFLDRLDPPVSEKEYARLMRMLAFEGQLWNDGFSRIAGVDEAGRGPLAGPIVAAAVVLDAPLSGLNDSKRLDAVRRDALCARIMSAANHVGVAVVSADEIDRRGIQACNYGAMAQAVAALPEAPDFVLVDGYALSGLRQPTMRVVKGDTLSLSIAAASIVAKTTRDRIMMEMDETYPAYGFARHKGYGVPEHLKALAAHGPCPVHRRSFAPLATREDPPSLL